MTMLISATMGGEAGADDDDDEDEDDEEEEGCVGCNERKADVANIRAGAGAEDSAGKWAASAADTRCGHGRRAMGATNVHCVEGTSGWLAVLKGG